MSDAPQNVSEAVPQPASAPRNWRSPLSIGLAVGVAFAVSRGVQANLEPLIGYWGAFAASVAAAGVVGALVALAVLGTLLADERRKSLTKSD